MSFRTDPLPSYEDIVSGNFLKSKSAAKENINAKHPKNREIIVKKEESLSGTFKYVKEGEVSEEGEISDSSDISTKNKNNSNKRSTLNNKINTNNKQKKIKKDEKSPNFSSNTTATTKPSNASTLFVPRLICRYFMEGICSKGDKCTFSHSVVPNKTPEEARVKEPCKFFIMGSCMKGEACYYSHDLSTVPCKFFHLKGECSAVSRGSACRFSHAPIDNETLEKLRSAESERIKAEANSTNLSVDSTRFISSSNDQSSAPQETSQTTEETEKSTDCPHDYLNPFAFDGSDVEEDGEC